MWLSLGILLLPLLGSAGPPLLALACLSLRNKSLDRRHTSFPRYFYAAELNIYPLNAALWPRVSILLTGVPPPPQCDGPTYALYHFCKEACKNNPFKSQVKSTQLDHWAQWKQWKGNLWGWREYSQIMYQRRDNIQNTQHWCNEQSNSEMGKGLG